jgi:hypothetical protein
LPTYQQIKDEYEEIGRQKECKKKSKVVEGLIGEEVLGGA